MNQPGWTNIPHCLTQAISTLVDKINSNTSEIEDLKNSLSDLLIKFQVKTSRLDSTLQELSLSYKSTLPVIKEDITTLTVKTDTIISNFESKLKPVNENLNDLKIKTASLASDLKKEVREFTNKLEKLKYEQTCLVEENFDRAFDKIHANDVAVQKKMQSFAYRQEEDFAGFTKGIEKLRGELAVSNLKISEQAEMIGIQFENFRKLDEKIEGNRVRVEEIVKEQEGVGTLLETLTRPVQAQPQAAERKKTAPKDAIINPIFERISQVDEKIDESIEALRLSLSSFEKLQQHELSSTKLAIESWALEKINTTLAMHFQKLKEKLEWLPDSSSQMKNMGITEARLFILESRLRSEEKQRILNDQQIMDQCVDKGKPVSKPFGSRRRGSLSPSQTKLSYSSIDKKPSATQHTKPRPNSSYQHREVNSQDRLKDRLLIKV